MQKRKRRLGDRRDGTLLRDLDSMHIITPMLYPNRCDNEAYVSQAIDCTNLMAWLEKKNAEEQLLPYTMFHLIVAASLKAVQLRPKMNRFIANKNMYQRNEITAAFVVKKQFSDHAGEALAFVHAAPEDTIEDLHEKLRQQIQDCRSDKVDRSTESMDIISKLLRWLVKLVVRFASFLDRHGWCPNAFIASDPYYSTVLLSNVGSVGLQSGYHHLTNWGTTSIFCLIGKREMKPIYDAEGNVQMKPIVELGLTLDERIADGYYFSGTARLLKKLLENPELLERPLNEEVDY